MATTTEKNGPCSKYRLDAEAASAVRTNPPCVLNVLEAAAYLGISPRKIRDLLYARAIKHAKIGARIVIRKQYLDEFVSAKW